MDRKEFEKIKADFEDAVYPEGLLEKYELLECLAASATAETLLARDRSDNSRCVVKCYFAGNPLFELTEPENIKRIDHPLLPHYIGEYRSATVRCILREYIPGEPLSVVCSRRHMGEKEVQKIGLQLCQQLEYLHAQPQPIIHRDIKPENVILRDDSNVSLIDFGISKVYTNEKKTETIAFGTKGFAPPEQYGFAKTDARSDIFSLGILLGWLLHGEEHPLQKPKTSLEKVLAKCSAFDPAKRYAGAGQVKRALKYSLGPHRFFRTACIAAASLLLLAGAGLFLARQTEENVSNPLGFQSDTIYQAARASMQLNGGEQLTEELLPKVKALYIVGDTVYSASSEFYAGIETWYQNGQIRGDVSPLDDTLLIPNLKEVCIVGQQIKDLSVLAELKDLEKLEIKHNYVTDLSPLAGLQTLTYVGLNSNPVTDLSPLTQCPNLRFLDLCDVDGYDGKVFAELGDFTALDISNRTDSYRYLDSKEIQYLKIAWSSLDTLVWLDEVSGLLELEINNSKVTDLSPIVRHTELQSLNIAGLAVKDLRPLLDLPELQTVTISTDMDGAMEALGDVPFAVRYQ